MSSRVHSRQLAGDHPQGIRLVGLTVAYACSLQTRRSARPSPTPGNWTWKFSPVQTACALRDWKQKTLPPASALFQQQLRTWLSASGRAGPTSGPDLPAGDLRPPGPWTTTSMAAPGLSAARALAELLRMPVKVFGLKWTGCMGMIRPGPFDRRVAIGASSLSGTTPSVSCLGRRGRGAGDCRRRLRLL